MEKVLKEVVVAKNLTRCCVKNVLEMIITKFRILKGTQWVCAKHMFRSYLGNEERSEDEVDGGLTKVNKPLTCSSH